MDFRNREFDSGNDLVSILVASYNNSQYILETLNSIKNQTYGPIELLIIDDASKDNVCELIENWILTNNFQVKFIKKLVNKGVCDSANTLIDNASGRFLSFFATDDIMLPNRIELLVRKMNSVNEKVGFIYHDVECFGENITSFNFLENKKVNYLKGNLYEDLVLGRFRFPTPGNFVKREVFDKVGKFDPRLRGEDIDMWFRVAEYFEFDYIEMPLVKYRIHGQSLSRNSSSIHVANDKSKYYLKHVNSSNTKVAAFSRKSVEAALYSLFKKEISINEFLQVWFMASQKFFSYKLISLLVRFFLVKVKNYVYKS
jgi:glycosyltransferase involved in cell wall biosynthesis